MKQLGIGPLINFFNRQGKDEVYRSIAGAMLTNISRLGELSIQETADLCFTSTATVSRVAKKAGYDGYNDLKENARQHCAGYFKENRVLPPERLADADTAEAYLSTIVNMYLEMNRTLDRDQIQQAIDLVHKADAIYYFGTCDAIRRFQQDLFVTGKYVEVYQAFSAESPRIIEWKKNSLAIVENPGYPWFETGEVVRRILESGTKVLQITCSLTPELDEKVNLSIHLSGTKSGRDEVLYQALLTILSLEYRKQHIDSWYYQK